MNIPKSQIEQWAEGWYPSHGTVALAQIIAQRAVEWERERLSKIAGEPVAYVFGKLGDADVCVKPRDPLHTQDQTLGAIVRSEDAVTKKLHPFNANETTLEKVVEAIPASINEATLTQQITLLESQLAQCKADAERLTDCRIELVITVHGLASHFENRLHRLDADDRKLAEGDIAHAMKNASKWNWNGRAARKEQA